MTPWIGIALLVARTAAAQATDSKAEPAAIHLSGSDRQTANDRSEADRQALAAGAASLAPLTTAITDRAWASGVTAERQEAARSLFTLGNSLLKESRYLEAESKYREALTIWEHPGIHYNLALVLINLDRPLEIREQLRESLRYGPIPLDEERFENVRRYLKLVERQLALLELTCDEPDAAVMLDGTVLFHGPGRFEGATKPGLHIIQVIKPGYVSRDYRMTLFPGDPTRLKLRLYTEAQLTETKRLWNPRGPTLLTGAGALILGAGVVFLMQSNSKYRGFDQRVAALGDRCQGPVFCPQTPELTDLQTTARNYRILSAISLATGSAALVSGAVLMIANRRFDFRLTPEQRDRSPVIQPALGVGFAGITGFGHF